MTGVFQEFSSSLLSTYNTLISALPTILQKFIPFFLLALVIFIYAVLIWKFYQSISKKNLLELNLNKYNQTKHPILTKIFAGALYLTEYILIMPFLIFVWFAGFTILLIFITEGITTPTLLLLAGTLIAAIRMTAYTENYKGLSTDIAKLVPLTLLATSLLNPNFFSIERIINTFTEIPTLFQHIGIYLFFIIILEILLRLFDFIVSLFGLEEPKKQEEEKE